MAFFLGQFDDATFSFTAFNFVWPEGVKPSCSINDITKFSAKTRVKMPRRTYTAEIYIVYLYLYNVTWDASLLNQFLACSVGAKILPGKHSVAFILTQLGVVLISGTFVYIAVSSLTRIAYCAYLPLLSCRRYPLSYLLVLTDKKFCSLQFHISTKKQIVTEFISQVQRCIHDPVKHLR